MLEFLPQRHIFDSLASKANILPVYGQLLCDQIAPVLAFERPSGDGRVDARLALALN